MTGITPLKGAVIGAGFFADIQMRAWRKIPEAEIVAVCDTDLDKARAFADKHEIPHVYTDVTELLEYRDLAFVDIVTRPDSHLALVREAVERGLAVLCQKPLAPTHTDAQAIVALAEAHSVRLMVNENWRWQRWYREIKALVDAGRVGTLFHVALQMRSGDGRGAHPYSHQPYFSAMPRLLIFETLVHHIDTLRFFLGEVTRVYAVTRRLNPVIQGEDLALLTLEFEGGATAVIDANRYTEPALKSDTFGHASFEGTAGTVDLTADAAIYVRALEEQRCPHPYTDPGGYRGGSCYGAQRHFVTALRDDTPFETGGHAYLKTLEVVEAAYHSAACGEAVSLETFGDE